MKTTVPTKPGHPRASDYLPPKMSPTFPVRSLFLGCLALSLPALTQAQDVAPEPSAPTTDAGAEEILALSPFEVKADRDDSFAAASALAGGRLALDLKDTPAAYSVITRDFIDALGITDLTQASNWTTNTLVFADGQGGGDFFNITVPISIRGAGTAAMRQRNFFLYYAPMDSYSLERYDFGRGPNSVLFGNGGTLGGVQTAMTKRARFGNAFQRIEQSIGSWDNYRTVVDINQPLGNRVAVRASAVYGDRDGWRDNEKERTKAAFATATVKLAAKTELRIEGEIGRQDRNIPRSFMRDFLAGWDGNTVFSGPMTDAIRNGTAPTASGNFLTGTGAPQGVDRRGSNFFVYDPQNGIDSIVNFQNQPFTRGGGSSATTPIGGFTQVGSQGLGSGAANLLYSFNVPGNRFDTAIENSYFRMPDEETTMALNNFVIEQEFSDRQITLSHQIGDSWFFEIAGAQTRSTNRINQDQGRGTSDIYIDINRVLPTGQNNPNFLQPYAIATYARAKNVNNVDSLRAAIAYVKDAGRWGKYSVSIMGGLIDQELLGGGEILSLGLDADRRQWGNEALGVRFREYLYTGDRSSSVPTRAINYVNPLTNQTSTVSPFWAPWTNRADANQRTANRYNYAQGALISKFFKDRLVTVLAGRYDDFSTLVELQRVQGDYPTDWDGRTVLYRPAAPADYFSLSYVPKNASGVPIGAEREAANRPRTGLNPQAQYANDRFKDDYSAPVVTGSKFTKSMGAVVHVTSKISAFYNFAESYSLPIATPKIDGSVLPPVEGDGTDVGLRFALLKDRLNISVGRYENSETGSYIDPASVTGQINGLYSRRHLDDVADATARNRRGATDIPGVVRDFRDRSAEGYELELVANITRNWRTILNVGLPKVYEENAYPETKAYVATNTAIFQQILEDAGGTVNAQGIAVVRPGVPTTGTDAQATVNNYNAIFTNLTNFVADRRIVQDQPNANVFTDYTFNKGRLKGLRLGVGLNYRAKQIVGYRGSDTIVNPANPAQSIDNPDVDAYDPVYSPDDDYTVTATVAYRWRLKGNREINLNLRISNLLNERGPIYQSGSTAVRPLNNDYTSPARETVPNGYALKQPISFYLTAGLKL